MTNTDNFNPVIADLEFLKRELPAMQSLQMHILRKPGPVRALPISEATWARLESIKPYPESPIHD